MQKGSEFERVAMAAIDAGVINIHEILKVLRQESDETGKGATFSVEIPTRDLDRIRELMIGDMFRSEDELLAVVHMTGLLAMKFAIDHPDDFDLDLFFSEMDENMDEEGW